MSLDESRTRDRSVTLLGILAYILQSFAFGVLYFFLVRLGVDLVSAYPSATPIWSPAGFALAAVLVGGYRFVPAIFAAAFLAGAPSVDATYAAASAAGAATQACAGALLINSFANGQKAFAAPATIVNFLLICMFAAAIGAAVSAGVHAGVGPLRPDNIDWADLARTWFPFWVGDLVSMLLITPFVVLWVTDHPRSLAVQPFLETSVLVGLASALGAAAFSPLLAEIPNRMPWGVVALPLLLWTALRSGPRSTATLVLVLSGLLLWGTIVGSLPLASSAGESSTLLAAMVVIGIAVPSLMLAADAALRRRTERILNEYRRELAEARIQFAEAQKMEAIGRLTGGVAHDFNNLLTVIAGNLEIAQRHLESSGDGPTEERLRRVVNNAMRGAQRATTITQRLLAFSRKQPLEPKPLDLNKFLRDLSDFLRRSLGETVALEILGGDGLWHVEADPIQLEATILNLAVNARDAMPKGGRLTITTRNTVLDENYSGKDDEFVAGDYVEIALRDTGTGMPPDILARVFEPFFTTKVAGQGTGLGLSQVYGFVKQSRGHIHIDSQYGEGTTVKIFLPRLAREPDHEKAPETELAADIEPTILVVEDNHDVRAYVVEILRELHYRVLETHDAESALAMVDRNDAHIDLLLTDVVLPGMNGRQLAEALKLREPGMRILFMSGYSQDALVHEGRLDPGVQLIQKPLSQELLEQRVRAMFENGRPHGQQANGGAGAAKAIA
jgi:signal transduction histidine kinase